jgi:hypothetical protein
VGGKRTIRSYKESFLRFADAWGCSFGRIAPPSRLTIPALDEKCVQGRSRMQQRAAYRFISDTTVNCRVPESPDRVTISNISTSGCRLLFEQGTLLPGTALLVEVLPGFHALGKVVWKNGEEAGFQFDRCLDETLVEHIRSGEGVR